MSGTSFASPSVHEKVTGKTQWVGDVRLPGMLHARMVRPATLGSTLVKAGSFDKAKFPTAEVVTKGNLVAVVSNGTAVLGLGDIGAHAAKPDHPQMRHDLLL